MAKASMGNGRDAETRRRLKMSRFRRCRDRRLIFSMSAQMAGLPISPTAGVQYGRVK
jgi:hypothetical protein